MKKYRLPNGENPVFHFKKFANVRHYIIVLNAKQIFLLHFGNKLNPKTLLYCIADYRNSSWVGSPE